MKRYSAIIILTIFIGWPYPLWSFQAPAPQQFPPPTLSLPVRAPTNIPSSQGVEREEFTIGEIPGIFVNEGQLVDSLHQYLQGHPEWLAGLSLDELEVGYTVTLPGQFSGSSQNVSSASLMRPTMRYVEFYQKKEGMRVEGSRLSFMIKHIPNGRNVIMSIESRLFPQLRLPSVRTITADQLQGIKARARRVLGLSKDAPVIVKGPVVRWADIDTQEGWFPLVTIYPDESNRGFYRYVETSTGQGWFEYAVINADVVGLIQGRGTLFDPSATGSNLDSLPLRHLQVDMQLDDQSETIYTDEYGSFYKRGTPAHSATVETQLQGRWVKVTSKVDPDLSLTSSQAIRGDIYWKLMFNPTDFLEYPTAQVNGYYHTTYIHDYASNLLNIQSSPIDRQLPIKVNTEGACNAGYSEGLVNIEFYKAGKVTNPFTHEETNCINFAYDTVVDHEYGHFIDDMFGGVQDHALSEGWGDVMASYASKQPFLAEGAAITSDPHVKSALRTTDNTYQYPRRGNGEVHEVGQAWSGFAWDLRKILIQELGEQEGVALAERLVIPTIVFNARSISKAVVDVVLWDDDDGDLSNGTPHLSEIISAAEAHSIPAFNHFTLKIDTPKDDAFILSNSNKVMIAGTATGIGSWKFQSYSLRFGEGIDPTTWNPITDKMTQPVYNGALGEWDIRQRNPGVYTLSLIGEFSGGKKVETRVEVVIGDFEVEGVKQIITPADVQSLPDIFKDNLVWQEEYFSPNAHLNLYRQNLRTIGQTALGSNQGDWEYASPAVWENQVVATVKNKNDFSQSVVWFNPDGVVGQPEILATGGSELNSSDISGKDVVWMENRLGEGVAIDYMNLQNRGVGPQVMTKGLDRLFTGHPHIWNRKMVFTDDRGTGVPNVYLYDFSHPELGAKQLVSSPLAQWAPDIWGEKVVYYQNQDSETSSTDIYMFDLRTGENKQITNSPTRRDVLPRNGGNLVVWQSEETRGGNWDIFAYNIRTGKMWQVTTNKLQQRNPVASESGWIAWEDNRTPNAGPRIFFVEVPEGAFIRGDANNDGNATMDDAIYILNWLFKAGPGFVYAETADVNGDGQTNLTDAVYLLNYLFTGGPKPPPLFPNQ